MKRLDRSDFSDMDRWHRNPGATARSSSLCRFGRACAPWMARGCRPDLEHPVPAVVTAAVHHKHQQPIGGIPRFNEKDCGPIHTITRAAQARDPEAEGRAGYSKKGRSLLREGSGMKFVFITKHRSIWPVAWLCNALGVSRFGFHVWLNRTPSARSQSDEALGKRVKTLARYDLGWREILWLLHGAH